MSRLSIILLLLALPQAAAQGTEDSLFAITIRNAAMEQRFVRTRTEQEAVATNIMDSDVQGQQTTTTATRLRILPDGGRVPFELTNIGEVSSQTTGINSQARVDSVGQHHFEVTKPFWFDGTAFLTQQGHGTIQASQAPQCVMSAVGATMPLLRPLSDRIAWDQVTRRQAEINQAVAENISRDVLPKIDRILDEEFARVGRQLSGFQTQVEATLRTTPVSWVARSSDTSFSIAAIPKHHGDAESGFNTVPVDVPLLSNGEELAFAMSDSVATAFLEQYVPSGLMLSDTQVQEASKVWNNASEKKWSVASLMQLLREIERNASAEPTMFSIQLAQVQPVAIRFDRGDVCIETSFQIIPKVGSPSGWMKTTWRMRGREVSDDQWAVALNQVDVGDTEDSIPVSNVAQPKSEMADPELRIPSDRTFEPNESLGSVNPNHGFDTDEPQVTTVESGTVWRSVVENATQSLLKQIPAATLPKEFDGPEGLPGSPKIRLMRIESADGVLRAAFRLIDSVPQPHGDFEVHGERSDVSPPGL